MLVPDKIEQAPKSVGGFIATLTSPPIRVWYPVERLRTICIQAAVKAWAFETLTVPQRYLVLYRLHRERYPQDSVHLSRYSALLDLYSYNNQFDLMQEHQDRYPYWHKHNR